MNRNQKQEFVALAKDILTDNKMCILLNYKGLNAGDFTKLRNELKDRDANVKIIKNTLAKKALDGTNFIELAEQFKDQIAISFSNDPIALANVVNRFSKDSENLKIQAVLMDGKIVDNTMVAELASLGSLDDVRARFIGVLRAPGSKLARVLAAYEEKLKVA